MNCFHWSSFHSTKLHITKTLSFWAHLTKRMREQRQPMPASRLHDGRWLLFNQRCSLPSSQAGTSACTALYHSVISQALIFSSCKPISWLTPLSMSLRALSRDSLCKKPFTRARVCVHPENKVPLVLLVWCQGQFLIPFYKAFLLLMQQLVDY